VVDAYDPDALDALPGDVMTRTTRNGIAFALVSSDDDAIYLEGEGYREAAAGDRVEPALTATGHVATANSGRYRTVPETPRRPPGSSSATSQASSGAGNSHARPSGRAGTNPNRG